MAIRMLDESGPPLGTAATDHSRHASVHKQDAVALAGKRVASTEAHKYIHSS